MNLIQKFRAQERVVAAWAREGHRFEIAMWAGLAFGPIFTVSSFFVDGTEAVIMLLLGSFSALTYVYADYRMKAAYSEANKAQEKLANLAYMSDRDE